MNELNPQMAREVFQANNTPGTQTFFLGNKFYIQELIDLLK